MSNLILLVKTHPESKKYEKYIDDTLTNYKIPTGAQNKIKKECCIILAGYNTGDQCGIINNHDIIVFNIHMIDHVIKDDFKIHRTIAHEFAHHYLNHKAPMEKGIKEKNEKEVEVLLKKWGF